MREYIKFWSFSCVLYLACCICEALPLIFSEDSPLISAGDSPSLLVLILNILCLYTILYIFRACCSIDNISYKKFWSQYPLLLMTYGLVLHILKVDPTIITLPFSVYELLLTIAAAYTITKQWRLSAPVRFLFSGFVSFCFLYQIYTCYAILFEQITFVVFGINVLLLLLLNFGFAYLYQRFLEINQSIREDYLYTLAEKAADIIFYYTLQPYPRFTFISPSVETIVGYKQNDFYKNPKLILELTHEEDREVISRAFSEEAGAVNKNFIRWQRSDSEYIYLEFHNTPVYSGDELIAVEGILRDITDRKLVEQEMVDSKKSRQLLLSYISHELKTPITYIVGYAEALQNNLFSDDEERRNATELIYSKSVFLQNLVEDLFQLSKMESNQFSFEFMQTKVSALYRYLADKHRRDVSAAKINYFCQMEEALKEERYEVLVDIKRIDQVFGNLLNNAVKHTPEGGNITFSCLLDEKRENIMLKISDSGTGIPPEELPYIFKAFYRGKNNGAQSLKGSGLGLSLSRQIMLSHKGNIEAQSVKDKGSIFIVTIPLYTEEEESNRNIKKGQEKEGAKWRMRKS